jgi:hypothetical protein
MGVKETDGFRDIMAGVEIQKGLKDRKRDGAENKIYIEIYIRGYMLH